MNGNNPCLVVEHGKENEINLFFCHFIFLYVSATVCVFEMKKRKIWCKEPIILLLPASSTLLSLKDAVKNQFLEKFYFQNAQQN